MGACLGIWSAAWVLFCIAPPRYGFSACLFRSYIPLEHIPGACRFYFVFMLLPVISLGACLPTAPFSLSFLSSAYILPGFWTPNHTACVLNNTCYGTCARSLPAWIGWVYDSAFCVSAPLQVDATVAVLPPAGLRSFVAGSPPYEPPFPLCHTWAWIPFTCGLRLLCLPACDLRFCLPPFLLPATVLDCVSACLPFSAVLGACSVLPFSGGRYRFTIPATCLRFLPPTRWVTGRFCTAALDYRLPGCQVLDFACLPPFWISIPATWFCSFHLPGSAVLDFTLDLHHLHTCMPGLPWTYLHTRITALPACWFLHWVTWVGCLPGLPCSGVMPGQIT